MARIITDIYGETSTRQINPDMALGDRRVDEKTKELIKKHNYLSDSPKEIKIYIARSQAQLKNKEGSTYNPATLFWSVDKSSAIRGAEKLTKQEVSELKKTGWF
jgi:hypothetical protein